MAVAVVAGARAGAGERVAVTAAGERASIGERSGLVATAAAFTAAPFTPSGEPSAMGDGERVPAAAVAGDLEDAGAEASKRT